jgi:hypothetical protein
VGGLWLAWGNEVEDTSMVSHDEANRRWEL